MSDREIDFAEMIGGEFDFYGCDEQRFNLDGLVYEVIGDYDCLDEVRLCQDSHGFHDLPIARVVIEEADVGIYEFTDLHDGHCWLRFGTEYHCDAVGRVAWQYFIFKYTPREPGD